MLEEFVSTDVTPITNYNCICYQNSSAKICLYFEIEGSKISLSRSSLHSPSIHFNFT
jgi:hypothetical protein